MMETNCDSPDSSGQACPHYSDDQDDGAPSRHGRVRRRDQDTQTQLKSSGNTSLIKLVKKKKASQCHTQCQECPV